MQDETDICIWKSSYLENGSTFNDGKLMPDADLNKCVSCSDYTQGSSCLFYVPKTDDRDRFIQAIRLKLQKVGGQFHENV